MENVMDLDETSLQSDFSPRDLNSPSDLGLELALIPFEDSFSSNLPSASAGISRQDEGLPFFLFDDEDSEEDEDMDDDENFDDMDDDFDDDFDDDDDDEDFDDEDEDYEDEDEDYDYEEDVDYDDFDE